MIKFLIILLLTISPVVEAGEFRHFNDWTKKEKAEFIGYSALVYIDYRQTSWTLNQKNELGNPIYYERNPIFGERPNKKDLLAAQILAAGVYYYMVGDSHDPFLRGAIFGLRLAVVVQNDNVGARIYKVF